MAPADIAGLVRACPGVRRRVPLLACGRMRGRRGGYGRKGGTLAGRGVRTAPAQVP